MTKIKKTVSVAEANNLGLLIILPVLVLYISIFYYTNPNERTLTNISKFISQSIDIYGSWVYSTVFLTIIISGIIVHELIHGVCWALYAKKGFKSISFGIVWQFINPYCHCKEPLKLKNYIFGALMPGFLLGLLPTIYAIIFNHIYLFIFDCFFTIAAGGDLLMVYILRKESIDTLVQDHPTEPGCYIYNK